MSLQDLMNEEINAALAKETANVQRIKSGGHRAVISGVREAKPYPDWHDGAGMPRSTWTFVFENEDGDRIGTVNRDLSHKEFSNAKSGKRHADVTIFYQIANAVAPNATKVGDVIYAAVDQAVYVFGRETYKKVIVDDLPDRLREDHLDKGRSGDAKVTVYLENDDDEVAERLIERGYKPDFTIYSVGALKRN